MRIKRKRFLEMNPHHFPVPGGGVLAGRRKSTLSKCAGRFHDWRHTG